MVARYDDDLRFAHVGVLYRPSPAKAARYCTKHHVVRYVPGGPDHLVWVYGPHRTPVNACDGPEHQRSPAWW